METGLEIKVRFQKFGFLTEALEIDALADRTSFEFLREKPGNTGQPQSRLGLRKERSFGLIGNRPSPLDHLIGRSIKEANRDRANVASSIRNRLEVIQGYPALLLRHFSGIDGVIAEIFFLQLVLLKTIEFKF